MPLQTPTKPRIDNPFLRANLENPYPKTFSAPQNALAFRPTITTLPIKPARAFRPKKRSYKALYKMLQIGLVAGLLLFLIVRPELSRLITPSPSKPITTAVPVHYRYISSEFGPRWGRMHEGMDFAASTGTPIYAASDGTVIHSGRESGYGNSVVITHGHGMQTRYGHCSRLLVKVGDKVSKGDVIAEVGSTGHSTGPHLHFEVIINGEHKNPAWYYPFQTHKVALLD